MHSYFSLPNLSFVENNHISIFTTFAKQSMINRLSNLINRNRSAAKISKVMSSNGNTLFYVNALQTPECQVGPILHFSWRPARQAFSKQVNQPNVMMYVLGLSPWYGYHPQHPLKENASESFSVSCAIAA